MKGKNIVGFVLLISLSLLACITIFASQSSGTEYIAHTLARNFLYNFPGCLATGFIDYKIISFLHKAPIKHPYGRITADILSTTAFVSLLTLICVQAVAFFKDKTPTDLGLHISRIAIWNGFVVLVLELFLYQRRLLENEARLAVMEKEKAQYQFETLKNQINPHFLFNSLNVLALLTYQDVEKANLFTKKLSSVYRYLLTTQTRQTVCLKEELDFLNAYLYLEKIRFGDAIRIQIDETKENEGRHVVPASLQLLVENALKHNISTTKCPLYIHILVGTDSLTVSNNLQLRNAVATHKIGLENLKKQYLIHGQGIKVTQTDKTFSVQIPLLPASLPEMP